MLWFFSTTRYLIVLYKCTKFHWNNSYDFRVIKRTPNCMENNQREITHKILKPELWFLCMTEITHKILKPELWFLCMTHRLIMLNKCTKLHWKILNGLQVIQRTRNCIENNQREITPKILKPELWFLSMTHCLIMLNKCIKFYWKILKGFQVIQRTQNCIKNNQREITPKILKPEL